MSGHDVADKESAVMRRGSVFKNGLAMREGAVTNVLVPRIMGRINVKLGHDVITGNLSNNAG